MVCAPLPALRRCSVQIIGGAAGLPQILEGGANLHMYPCREAEQSSSRRSYAKPAGEIQRLDTRCVSVRKKYDFKAAGKHRRLSV